jgi:hypothetical protein
MTDAYHDISVMFESEDEASSFIGDIFDAKVGDDTEINLFILDDDETELHLN